MLDTILVFLIVASALAYVIYSNIKGYKRLQSQLGACGHRCDHCPFAKYNDGIPVCPSNHKTTTPQSIHH